MTMQMDQTCWLGLEIGHPEEWEVSVLSGPHQPGRCTFEDRYRQRMEVQWKKVWRPRDPARLAARYGRRASRKPRPSPLADLPEGWTGAAQNLDPSGEKDAKSGVVVRAGRYFKAQRWLVEVTLIWPGERDAQAERRILSSIRPQDDQGKQRLWRVMGIHAMIPAEFRLEKSDPRVGRVRLEFAAGARRLSVERLALPDYWFTMSFAQWLTRERPAKLQLVSQGDTTFNGHDGGQMVSRSVAETLWAVIRGRRQYRLDVAWLCGAENRFYHVSYSQPRRDAAMTLPEGFELSCPPAEAGEGKPSDGGTGL